jgi:hypothetical protein
MKKNLNLSLRGAVIIGVTVGVAIAQSHPEMSFFITSVGSGNGGDFGGLSGADAHCQKLAADAGAGQKTWKAYLSTSGTDTVDARNRIGKGPWHNAQGIEVAKNLEELHMAGTIHQKNALTEKGQVVPGLESGRNNQHDILTGSTPQGQAFLESEGDRTCKNWTSSSSGGAMVGHHDLRNRNGQVTPWNSAHVSRGCSRQSFWTTGGEGLLYCFALSSEK